MRQVHKYPLIMRIGKVVYLTIAFLFSVLMIYIWIRIRPEDYESAFDFITTVLLPLLVPALIVSFVYEWSNIVVDEHGVCVEFFWKYLCVPWGDIVDVKHVGVTKTFGVWLISTRSNRLTPFHLIYGLWYGFRPRRSFVIRSRIDNFDDLIQKLRKRKYA